MASRIWLQIPLLILVVLFQVCVLAQTEANDDDNSWPRKFTADGKEFTIFQPQVESWKGNQLEERSAISVSSGSAAEPVYGVAWIKARTDIDKSERLVALQDIEVTKTNFPTEPKNESPYKDLLQKNSTTMFGTISLDRLRASLTINQSEVQHKVDGLKNEPPEIVYSDKPAVMVLVDGPGVMRETGLPNLLRVVNTRALIVFNKGDATYNMNVADHWYQAKELAGPWNPGSPQGQLLSNLNLIKDENAKEVETFDKADAGTAVLVSTVPTELIQTKGAAQVEPIQGTQLLYVTNTPDNIFLNTQDQNYFVTLSGRWFKAKSLKGPWKYVDADRLPADFARIPEAHPKGDVLASVAGTPDAREAAIANDIPQTATVDRDTAHLNVTYDGNPQFVAIQGTAMQYASNTATPVIMTSPNSYYAVENGVWFTGPTPQGPWAVATSVPQMIYTIPPSAPVYYVTYAYVYGAGPRYVYVGYMPGYLGSYVAPSGVVVYGTGYYYRPWVGTYYYGYPFTFGFGVAWGFGFGWAFRPAFYGAPVFHPWWGPWPHYWHGPYGYGGRLTVNHINVYHNWGGNVIRPGNVRAYNPGRSFGHGGAVHPTNNVYADHNGNVFRHEPQSGGWQQYNNSHQWQNVKNTAARGAMAPTRDLDRERAARQRGAASAVKYRGAAVSRSGNGGVKRR